MKFINSILVILAIIAIWVLLSIFGDINPLFLPKIDRVIASAIDLFNSGQLMTSLLYSFTRITVSSILSCVTSICLGLLVFNCKTAGELITPFTNFMRFIPVTIFYPLLIMWLGIDEYMKIAFLFVATFFFYFPTVVLCFKEIDDNLIETAYTIGMNKFQVLFNVILRGSLPSLLQNFLLMYGIGWTYIIIVEVTNAKFGLGHIINLGTSRGRTDVVVVATVLIVIVSILFDWIGNKIIHSAFKWKFVKEEE